MIIADNEACLLGWVQWLGQAPSLISFPFGMSSTIESFLVASHSSQSQTQSQSLSYDCPRVSNHPTFEREETQAESNSHFAHLGGGG